MILSDVENPNNTIDPSGSPGDLLNTASKDDEPPEPVEAANEDEVSQPASPMSSPSASNFDEAIADHKLDLSKRSMDFQV